ncbi:MAG: hypothetical protein EO766_17635 [Hydrotalea sp. AMD]|uniref:hypothetical protein n=1 Tax=Hydrotalea sp. AMD TaxID=2501297 RepID=UPI001026A8F1|nr:hypothetical protein [Hydrotalea sp. AMD]RWZ83507.1 MAG: hypothetical protein EO766_17635 [Hydrotalea sp. AMD]
MIKLYREYNDEGKVIKKQCGKCRQILDIDHFYVKGKVSKTNIDGYMNHCIECNKVIWKHHADDPEKRKRWLLARIKSKCIQNNIPFNLTIDDLVIPENCPILGIPLKFGVKGSDRFKNKSKTPDDSPSVDRIIPELGYVKGNIVVVSFRANNLKSNATPDELQKIAEFYKPYCIN